MVLPVHDVNPVRRTPVVTYLLIAVNVVAFLLSPIAATITGSGQPGGAVQRSWRSSTTTPPSRSSSSATTRRPQVATGEVGTDGRGRTGCVLGPPTYDMPPVLPALTAMFLHGGWLHLLGNMLYLFVFGNNVEDRLGRLRFLLFYLVCGYAATYGFAVVSPSSDTPLVGASGAIAGVLGAYLVLFPRARVWSLLTFFFFLPVRLPAWVVLGSWFVLQALYSGGAGITDATGGGGRRLPRARRSASSSARRWSGGCAAPARPACPRRTRPAGDRARARSCAASASSRSALAAVGLVRPRELAAVAGVRSAPTTPRCRCWCA